MCDDHCSGQVLGSSVNPSGPVWASNYGTAYKMLKKETLHIHVQHGKLLQRVQ